jgi:hypothetical protein
MLKILARFGLFLICCSIVVARKPKTNDDVLAMVKAGLPDSTVVLAVYKEPVEFDTTQMALIALKLDRD